MAFTSGQATKIRMGLGYPSVFKYENPRLEGAIITIGNDPDASAEVGTVLDDIDAVWTQIRSVALISTGLKSLDKGDVELYQDNQQTEGLREIGRIHCNRLSTLTGIDLAGDIFGTKGYPGDRWMGNARSSFSGLAGLG